MTQFISMVFLVALITFICLKRNNILISKKEYKGLAEERNKKYNAEQTLISEYKRKYGVPNFCYNVKCYGGDRTFNDRYIVGAGGVYFWNDNSNLYFAPTYNSNIKFKIDATIKIPIANIKSFTRQGDSYNEVHISGGSGGGGGGSSIKGALVGGVIAGGTGAIIGSRKKIDPIDPIRTENKFIDKRQTILEFYYIRGTSYLFFESDMYDKLLKLIPNKEINFIRK